MGDSLSCLDNLLYIPIRQINLREFTDKQLYLLCNRKLTDLVKLDLSLVNFNQPTSSRFHKFPFTFPASITAKTKKRLSN